MIDLNIFGKLHAAMGSPSSLLHNPWHEKHINKPWDKSHTTVYDNSCSTGKRRKVAAYALLRFCARLPLSVCENFAKIYI
jgi:hypothetical protein